jgi:hypothetical protein
MKLSILLITLVLFGSTTGEPNLIKGGDFVQKQYWDFSGNQILYWFNCTGTSGCEWIQKQFPTSSLPDCFVSAVGSPFGQIVSTIQQQIDVPEGAYDFTVSMDVWVNTSMDPDQFTIQFGWVGHDYTTFRTLNNYSKYELVMNISDVDSGSQTFIMTFNVPSESNSQNAQPVVISNIGMDYKSDNPNPSGGSTNGYYIATIVLASLSTLLLLVLIIGAIKYRRMQRRYAYLSVN